MFMWRFVVDSALHSQVATSCASCADVANRLCVFPGDPRSQQSGNRRANWRLEIRQCTLRSVKVICTNIECSLVFINPAGRIGPENQIKKCSCIVAHGNVQVPQVSLWRLPISSIVLSRCQKTSQKEFFLLRVRNNHPLFIAS